MTGPHTDNKVDSDGIASGAIDSAHLSFDHGGIGGLTDDDHSQYLNETRHDADDHDSLPKAAVTQHSYSHADLSLAIDDTPVDGETGEPISSNWAYDHKADPNAHHTPTASGDIDHGSVTGLTDDDHTQYLLADGSRDVAGDLIPDATLSRELGSTTKYWQKLWVNVLAAISGGVAGTLTCGTISPSTYANQGNISHSSIDGITVSSSTPSGGSDGDIWIVTGSGGSDDGLYAKSAQHGWEGPYAT